MTYQKFIKENEIKALMNNKEQSAVVLLMEHILNCETNELYLKMFEQIDDAEKIIFSAT